MYSALNQDVLSQHCDINTRRRSAIKVVKQMDLQSMEVVCVLYHFSNGAYCSAFWMGLYKVRGKEKISQTFGMRNIMERNILRTLSLISHTFQYRYGIKRLRTLKFCVCLFDL